MLRKYSISFLTLSNSVCSGVVLVTSPPPPADCDAADGDDDEDDDDDDERLPVYGSNSGVVAEVDIHPDNPRENPNSAASPSLYSELVNRYVPGGDALVHNTCARRTNTEEDIASIFFIGFSLAF